MERTLWDLLCKAAHDEPDRIALSEASTGRAVSWSALANLADRVSAGVLHLGMRRGDRIIIALPNRIEFVAAYFGILRAGLVAVPMNPRTTTGEFLRVMGDSQARMVIADHAGIASARAAVEGMRSVLRGPGTSVELITVEVSPEPGERAWNDVVGGAMADPAVREETVAPVRPDALAVLLYTSGTSGRPRGAMLTHRALVANIDQVARVDPPMLTGRDVVLALVPLSHIYGLNAVLGQAVSTHARMVLVDGFDPEESLDIIEDEAVSVVPAAPPVFAHWMQIEDLADRLGAVRFTLTGSAPISPDLVRAFVERTSIPLHQGYGMSEAAPVVTSTMASASNGHGALGGPPNGSVGSPLPGLELRIAKAEVLEGDTHAGPEGSGEIQIRGANLFSGYWPDGQGGPTEDGWYGTGDVGFLDSEGSLHLVDRLKELIIVSGFNVFPSEVEEVISELPDVADVAVVAVPDPITGEAVAAWVSPRHHADRDSLADEVVARCRKYLAGYKVPAVVHVVDRLPYSVTGKVQRGRLRSMENDRTPQNAGVSARVLLYSKPGCHLCDQARAVIEAVCAEVGTGFEEVDITASVDLMSAYGEQIPVTFVDGKQHDFWRVDAARLRRALDPHT